MRKIYLFFILVISVYLTIACALPRNKKVHLYYGEQPPHRFIRVVKVSPQAVTFEIRIKFPQAHLYHIIADSQESSGNLQGHYATQKGAYLSARKNLLFVHWRGQPRTNALLKFQLQVSCLLSLHYSPALKQITRYYLRFTFFYPVLLPFSIELCPPGHPSHR